MFLRDEPDTPSERQAGMPELLEDYKAHRMRLISQARELERLRQQVRLSAEREAAAIVTTARRNVRQVLLEARRELLILVAQVQAVGCDTPAEGAAANVLQGEATAGSIIPSASFDVASGSDVVNGARREVREVLLEAQTELLALADEARELRARVARQHGGELEFPSEHSGAAHEPEPAAGDCESAGQTEIENVPADYTPLPRRSRAWIPIAAAAMFAAVGVGVFLWSADRDASAGAPLARSTAVNQTQAAPEPAAQPTPPAVVAPASAAAPDPSRLAVTIDVRRPAWIRTTIDGRADIGRLFHAGESKTVTAREEIVMRAGDAGAVFVSVNGSEARALGGDGRVVTRRFGNSAAAAPKPAVLQAAAATASTATGTGSGESASADVGTTGTRELAAAPRDATAEREILRAAQQWFEAYFGGDTAGMKAIEAADFSIVDDRAPEQRLSATMTGVDRGLQQVRIDVAGEGAVMSARLTERANMEGQLREYVSLVSGVWMRTDGQWRLTGLRLIHPSSVGGRF